MVVDSPPIADVANLEDDDRYVTSGMIIDTGEGPRLCWGWGDSAPPACDGAPLLGIDADDVPGRSTLERAWWFEVPTAEPFLVEPDGDAFRWIGWVEAFDPVEWFGSMWMEEQPLPCTPDEGWAPPVSDDLGSEALGHALGALEDADPAITDTRIGRIVSLGDFPSDPAAQEEWFTRADSPDNLVLWVRSKDPDSTAELAAEVWAGRSCITGPIGFPADADDEGDFPEMFEFIASIRPGLDLVPDREPSGRWTVFAEYPDPELAAVLDERYGPGVVEVIPALLPARDLQVSTTR